MSSYANVARLQVGTSGETDGTELGNSAVEKAAPGAPPSGDAAGNAYLSGRSLLDFDPETRRSMIHFFQHQAEQIGAFWTGASGVGATNALRRKWIDSVCNNALILR